MRTSFILFHCCTLQLYHQNWTHWNPFINGNVSLVSNYQAFTIYFQYWWYWYHCLLNQNMLWGVFSNIYLLQGKKQTQSPLHLQIITWDKRKISKLKLSGPSWLIVLQPSDLEQTATLVSARLLPCGMWSEDDGGTGIRAVVKAEWDNPMCTLISPTTLDLHTGTPSFPTPQPTHPICSRKHLVSHCHQNKARTHNKAWKGLRCPAPSLLSLLANLRILPLPSLFHTSTRPHPLATLHIQNCSKFPKTCSAH